MTDSTVITRELLRKRAEHNDGEIYSLEEVSLHQQGIGKIENLDYWCPNLKILYLQANEISKIENLRRLKCLEYLNLALNKIEIIENLEGCESLAKLDLTLNCVRQVTSVASLTSNYLLRELYLTGNPCTAFDDYRLYVIATLPQLEYLDGLPVLHTERVQAKAQLSAITLLIKGQENSEPDDTPVERASEIRRQFRQQYDKRDDKTKRDNDDQKYVKFPISKDGRVLNSNQAQVKFKFIEDDDAVTLQIKLPKYLDTSLLEVDVQPTFVRVIIKGELLQLVLPEEVQSDRAVAQRSMASGDLFITMPVANNIIWKRSREIVRGATQKCNDLPALEPIA